MYSTQLGGIVHTSSSGSQSLVGSNSSAMGSKRGRLLIRQPRIKKDIDTGVTQSADLDTPEATVYSTLLTVPRMERHASEPTPAHTVSSPGLLAVPTSSLLIKQHSHPLLPSQSSPPSSSSYTLQRQLSHPLSQTNYSSISSPPIPLVSSHSSSSTHSLSKADSIEVGGSGLSSPPPTPQQHQPLPPSTTSNPTVVIVPDSDAAQSPPPLSTSSKSSSPTFPPPQTSISSGSGNATSVNTLSVQQQQRLKSEELHRSISTPLVRFDYVNKIIDN